MVGVSRRVRSLEEVYKVPTRRADPLSGYNLVQKNPRRMSKNPNHCATALKNPRRKVIRRSPRTADVSSFVR
jgi:hypothetical protein